MKRINYFIALLLAILIFSSNFLNTEIFKFGNMNFAVWFIISAFIFASGWVLNLLFNWNYGGKILFAVTVATTIISLLFITFFSDYFGISNLLSENLLLYSLRNVMLGVTAFFGMAVCEVLIIQKELLLTKDRLQNLEKNIDENKIRAELLLKDAELKAEKLLFDAENKAKEFSAAKKKIENELREIIQIEKELIKKYEEE